MKNVNALTECMYEGETQVRVLGTKEEPWFVAVDVLRILEIHTKNISRILERLDDDEKLVVKLTTNSTEVAAEYKTGNPDVWLVSEPGLYKIMLSSRSEKAKKFTRWVTHDVLPRIRKYGYYKLTNDERRIAAYKDISKSLGLSDMYEAERRYDKLPLYQLEAEAKREKYEAKLREEKAEVVKKYPYSYEEADKLCRGELEYIRLFIPKGEEHKYYTVINGLPYENEYFSEKFKKDVPKLMKAAYRTK